MNTQAWERQRAAMARASQPRSLRTVPARLTLRQRARQWWAAIWDDTPEDPEGDL